MEKSICRILQFNSPEQMASVDLRRKVLREPLGLEFSEAELESESDQVHIACFEGTELTGILLLQPTGNQILKMRQVAVTENKRDRGIGKLMVSFSERWAIENNFNKIELHARQSALNFYLSMQYQTDGVEFTEVSLPHFRMWKILNTKN